jgi:hypothetical protein
MNEGLKDFINTLNAYSFDTNELLFNGVHKTSLALTKHSVKWSELDYFTPINVEKNLFKDYSDIYVFTTKFSLMEREIYKSLGFDFDKVESICKSYVSYMHDFKMHQHDYFYIKAVFRESFTSKYDSFAGVAADGNYYSKEFSGGLNLKDARIYIQLFLHFKDGVIHPRAKITFPLSEEGYFSVIIGSDELYEVAQKVVKEGVLSEFKAFLIDAYPEECFDAVEFDEETLKQYLTVLSMEKI